MHKSNTRSRLSLLTKSGVGGSQGLGALPYVSMTDARHMIMLSILREGKYGRLGNGLPKHPVVQHHLEAGLPTRGNRRSGNFSAGLG